MFEEIKKLYNSIAGIEKELHFMQFNRDNTVQNARTLGELEIRLKKIGAQYDHDWTKMPGELQELILKYNKAVKQNDAFIFDFDKEHHGK